MEKLLFEVAEVFRGVYQLKDPIDGDEYFQIDYRDIQTKEENPKLTNTIKSHLIQPKIKLNLDKKYKQLPIQNNDIIVPVSYKYIAPRLVNFTDKEKYKNYVYYTKLFVIRAKQQYVLPKFLYYILDNDIISKYLGTKKDKWDKVRLTQKIIQDLKFDIPPFEEQQKILAKLEIMEDLELYRKDYFKNIYKE